MTTLLSRYAESVFWMARYVERAENLARILDVQETFARDPDGGQNWFSVVQLNADEQRFATLHDEATAETVVAFYFLDPENPNSILSTIRAARDNARTLRPLISTEMWAQLNMFYSRIRALTPQDLVHPELSRVCAMVKENCQAHTGITEGTFFRDQSWCFYQLGRLIERADQTTRLVDIKYHFLLPQGSALGSAVDLSQWNALLRSAAGYHAFRRVHPRGMQPASVAEFLLMNEHFPRSVALCIDQSDQLLHRLRSSFHVRGGNTAMERLDEIRAVLTQTSMEGLVEKGLHDFLDWLQLMLGNVSVDIARDFFNVAPATGPALAPA